MTTDVTQFENRIHAALDRIGTAVAKYEPATGASEDALEEARQAGIAAGQEQAQEALDRFAAEISQLKEALDAEQTANAQLRERVQVLKVKKERQTERAKELEAQSLELQDQQRKDRAELNDLIAALEPLVEEAT